MAIAPAWIVSDAWVPLTCLLCHMKIAMALRTGLYEGRSMPLVK